ncbi:hypothetical protein GE061_002343 [Apolygus lucorum]|uniref:Protein krueppel n=1 Tax=Apolygus lucorum TaxID=248454 RepID=A0A6A4J7V7_APOLU|nr:hypothetical protein GE061_002343 [Apolygus lucorum]
MDGLELCRLCALEKDNLLGIYDSEGLRLALDAKIKKCLNLEVSDREHFPKSICLECYSKLDAFDEFLDNSINAQATLSILYPDNADKCDQLDELQLPEENIKAPPEEEYEDDEGEFILGEVTGDLVINKAEFLESDKSFSESLQAATGSLEHCEEADVTSNILSAVEDEFIDGKTDAEERLEEGSDGDAESIPADKEIIPGIWLCSDCSAQFDEVTDLRQHHRTEHNQDERYVCDFCSKLFIDFNAFLTHLRRHKNCLKYSCEVCGKFFSNKKIVDAHKVVHTNGKPYVCSQCGKSFRQQNSLFLHSKCHLPEDIKHKFPCELCSKKFSSKPNLQTHMRIHAGLRNFTCDQCGKSFIQKGNLDAHLLTHTHDKPYQCEQCDKRFKTGMQLRKHHSVHTGAKPHRCDVCGRTFREKGTLREHHRIHTGAMPFSCEYCGKAFRFKGILTTHRRQHTGERPYSCHECQHHFTNWPNYNKHMKRRHGINTSRSARSDKPALATNQQPSQPTQPPPQQPPPQQPPAPPSASAPAPIFQEIQAADLYANIQSQTLGATLPTYMAYNVYSLSQVTGLDGTTIEIMPRQTITLKEAAGNSINFQT